MRDSQPLPGQLPTAAASAVECKGDEISACWANVGVYGKATCSKLEQFVHCRHCPVYSEAALRLLDRPLPPGYRGNWAGHFAEPRRIQEPGGSSAVLFRFHRQWLGLATRVFQEVTERRPIHSLPHRRPGAVLGLANVRGELLICASLDHLLGLESSAREEGPGPNRHRLLVINCEGARLALPVDEVHGPHRFHPRELKAPPGAWAASSVAFFEGILTWQQRAVILLDAERLLSTLDRSLA